jgi:hypothetical protein
MKKLIIGLIVTSFLLTGCNRGKRVGAICNDGWQSSATGSGACSQHDGVDHWLYESDKK